MSGKDLERVLALAFRWHLHKVEAGKVAVTRAPGRGGISATQGASGQGQVPSEDQ